MAENDNSKKFGLIAALGCGGLLLLVLIGGAVVVFMAPFPFLTARRAQTSVPPTVAVTPVPGLAATQEVIPTLPVEDATSLSGAMAGLYRELNPGVVSIQVYLQQQGQSGQGAGSGFILDEEGHIVTNNHVIAQADYLTVLFFDGYAAEAEVIGRDPDSDIAIIKVDELPDNVYPLRLGSSDDVVVGERVVAIGNPFGLGGSLTVGYVSAVGRTIASGATPFAIPQAIQTDAAINPGNSGGPLLNTDGEVIGVNAQIATGGTTRANAGVGFAIPINIVRRIAPVLIETGSFAWPWLGVSGGDVGLLIQEANDLPTQRGAYIAQVVEDGPAAEAGLQGATGTTSVEGFEGLPTGGDVVIAINGERVLDFSDLQLRISQREPGDVATLTILRDGEELEIDVELQERPRSG
jgi:2-alkenal reductase